LTSFFFIFKIVAYSSKVVKNPIVLPSKDMGDKSWNTFIHF